MTSAASPLSPASTPTTRPERYDTLARLLHWSMAVCFALVFVAALAHYLAEDSALDTLLWPIHKPLGALLFPLAIARAVWGLATAGRRPAALNTAAHGGHLVLYALMLAIPAIGLIRQYGSGRAFEIFGVSIFAAREDDAIEWMTQLGGDFHGELGWVFMACVAGHIGMALWHRRRGPNVLPRMIG